ncbi:hypothetical protein SL1157_1680 [Ruegeria lacuscaerulensis ITI-1157]|nr:hypothetical protein SL1157_1680 [Ruegeria lacuscaerulensis ITI-1157]SHK06175.1 hypothetical protein SAMN05444404_3216 [Ruegeria lacuscaerulensis ITI-1157]
MTEDEHDMIKEVHDFLFKPPLEGKSSRAEQLDEIMSAVRAGKMGTRILLWLAGVVAAVSAILVQFKGRGQ